MGSLSGVFLVKLTGKIIHLSSSESDELLSNKASLLLPYCELDVKTFLDASMSPLFLTLSGDGVIRFTSGSEGTGLEGSSGVFRSSQTVRHTNTNTHRQLYTHTLKNVTHTHTQKLQI